MTEETARTKHVDNEFFAGTPQISSFRCHIAEASAKLLGFERCPPDPTVYRHSDDMDFTVHVDDITLRGDYDVVMRRIEALQLELQVKISGELTKTETKQIAWERRK